MTEEKGLRKLNIDISELIFAMDDASYEHSYYLDVETGKTILVTSETRSQLEEITGEAPDDESDESDESDEEEFDLESALKQLDLPDWQKDALRDANAVEEGFGDRYIEIPKSDSDVAFENMEDFTDEVQNPKVQNQLSKALRMNHPFRHFKDVLVNHPDEQEQWFKFEEGRQREKIVEWLNDEGIEPVF